MKFLASKLLATAAVIIAASAGAANAETLRLLTWGSYAPDEVIKLFEAEYPDITVEATFSNNEEMVAKLRATGGAGFDLAQPGFNRVAAAQQEYNIYKPIDLSRINTDALRPDFLEQVKQVAAVDGVVYSVPHMWGTSGLVVNKTKAPEIKDWLDICDPQYEGRTSMRLKRSILVGSAFALGYNPYEAYADLDEYGKILDEVAEKLIACKSVIKTYWTGGDDLANLMTSGEVVASDTWDSTAFKLNQQNPDLVYLPPKSGTLGWIDTFTLPRKGEADDAAYKWINFVLRPDIIPLISASTGSIVATTNGIDLLPGDMKTTVAGAFTEADLANIKFAARILPGVEDLEGKVLERIKAAN
ncbi:extracellular solute-binding protein [Hoeflea sp.]|uniref:extracellular solute-binding protein n=1 Tax=Hoeflea sp. TaxID=1940281 RepID=UPI003A901F49